MSHAHAPQPRPFGAHRQPPPRAAKPRRPFGDPVAPVKSEPRFIPPPLTNLQYLNLSLHNVMPDDAIQAAGKIVFHAVGDTGGVHGTDAQEAIAEQMEAQVKAADEASKPAFLYHLGDVIYFNGQSDLYPTEFYEPYQYYQPYIFAIPGNHDGDTRAQRGDEPDTEPTLQGFMENFCDSRPHHNFAWRATMTQPYVYWTLEAPFVTIIGLYSNVDGSLDGRGTNEQQRWLEGQLKAASPDACLIVAVHHPPYSLDRTHGGSPDVGLALDRAIRASGRFPDAVLSGHVHSYQRFTRDADGRQIPYVVAGAGGYANTTKLMHQLQLDKARKPIPTGHPFQTTETDVVLNAYNTTDPGFLRLTVDDKKKTLVGEYFLVPFDGNPPSKPSDTFTLNWQTHKLH
jgi:hypothetical protein